MSEKVKGKEEMKENENNILDHFFHHHPLTLTEVDKRRSGDCFGCRRYIFPAETAYTCSEGCWYLTLHEECAEMPREIRLAAHPQHTLIQNVMRYNRECAVCEREIYWLGYYCSSSDPCEFGVHVWCAQNLSVVKSFIDHPSHPHQLTLLWSPGRSGSLRCHACGTIQKGNSYICTECLYWIHEGCATLSPTRDFHHHHHPLSLIYHLPLEYIKFDFKCDICLKALRPRYWVYGCQTCRYVVHINCAITASPASTSNIDVKAEGVIAFPIDNNKAVKELIVPFVMKNSGGSILSPPHDNEMIKGKYKFHNHEHELSLISSSSSSLSLHDIEEEEEKENSDVDADEDNDDLNFGNKSELVCDGCTLPINCSSSSNEYYYMSCGECKYFLHWECFHLPPDLPSHPLHLEEPNHNLTLQTPPKPDLTFCDICWSYTNGLFYECTKCDFQADIKCASLPDTIKHTSHLQHHLKLITTEITNENNYLERLCVACGDNTIFDVCYGCDICKIIMHAKCVSLPKTVNNPVWDKHPLQLTFDASVNHPSGFYCEICEEEMNPKMWMYHCRDCDFSLHPRCFPNASGKYRNVKFGQRYAVGAVHQHPLMYQLLSTKLRCDVCGERRDFGSRGFQCHSHACNFFMCFDPCGEDRLDSMQAVD